MMTEAVKGKSTAEAEEIFEAVRTMFTKGNGDADEEKLGDLVILSGVSEFPTRIKCATLAWHALHTALQGRQQTVSTE
jgi:nitrogen fixation NifU-like protein